jgi:hypothetical protein
MASQRDETNSAELTGYINCYNGVMPSDNEKIWERELTLKGSAPIICAVVLTLLLGYLLVSNIRLSQRVAQLEERSSPFNGFRGRGFRRNRGGAGMDSGRGPMGAPGGPGQPGLPVGTPPSGAAPSGNAP